MNDSTVKQLEALLKEGENLTAPFMFPAWSLKARAFIAEAIGQDESDRFMNSPATRNLEGRELHGHRMGHIAGLAAKARQSQSSDTSAHSSESRTSFVGTSRKVFVVHGHDNEAKESTARFLEKLKLEPVILHEQASGGRTVIEKFEVFSEDVAFAVILLTPDDIGAASRDPNNLRSRARQNVILELGYFLGRLGRTRVCALHRGNVELPSDYQGVLFVEQDDAGAWKAKLAQELVQAKISIDLAGLLGA